MIKKKNNKIDFIKNRSCVNIPVSLTVLSPPPRSFLPLLRIVSKNDFHDAVTKHNSLPAIVADVDV